MEQKAVDLNCDLGESFGTYTLGRDEQVIPFISSANIACGYHASDPMVMHKTINLAKKYEVAVGAHPGFPDLLGFGRRNMNVEPKEAKAYMTYQLGALYGFARSSGIKIQHVKPHGAMYNMAGKDYQLARAICEAVYEFDSNIILLGLAKSQLTKAAKAVGIRFANEFFADRAYEDDGSLVARTKQGSMITDEKAAISRVVKVIKEHQVTSMNGKTIPLKINSVCVHGDGEKALQFVKRIREQLQEEQIQVKPLHVICK